MDDTATLPEYAALGQCLDEAAAIEGVDGEACGQLRQRFAEGAFNLVVAGQFKRGKSSVINALLGVNLLPVGVVPLTSVVTLLRFGSVPRTTVAFLDGGERDIALDTLADYVTEKANPGNAKGVREVAVAYPSEWLRGGIRLADTPGIGSVYQHNTDAAYRYLPQADAVLVVASVDQPVSGAELDFLADVRQYADKVFCLLNKADYLDAEQLREAVAFSAQAVGRTMGAPVPIFPVSAKLALAGKLGGGGSLVAHSGFPELDRAPRRLLTEERSEFWCRSMGRNLMRILAQARLAADLELKALSAPIEQVEANLEAFARKKQETLQSRSDYDVLLEADTKKLLKNEIEPALDRFKGELMARMATSIEGWFEELKALPSRSLQKSLEERSIAEIGAAYDAWRAARDADTPAVRRCRHCSRESAGLLEARAVMIEFAEPHRTRLASAFAEVDERLAEATHCLDLAALRSPFSRRVADVTPVQQQLIADYAQRMRSAMREILDRHGIPPPPPTASALQESRTALNQAVIAIEELGPRYLCAYGALSDELEAELNRIVSQLLDMLDHMEGFLGQEEGPDLRARLERLGGTRPDLRLLDELARVIAGHDLAQFRAPLQALIERFEADDFEVAVFGRTNSGKSSLVNRLLGAEIVPVGAMPVWRRNVGKRAGWLRISTG